VIAPAQGALRRFTQWPSIEHSTFRLTCGHFTAELLPPPHKSFSGKFEEIQAKCPLQPKKSTCSYTYENNFSDTLLSLI